MTGTPDVKTGERPRTAPSEPPRRTGRLYRFVSFDLLGFWNSRPAWIGAVTLGTLTIALIMALGAYLRAKEYFSNRSIWADEAMLSLNIVNRSFTGLLEPLDMEQAAPHGFLFLQKLGVTLLGNSVRGLRLFPFLASLLSLPLFYAAVRRILGARGAGFALFLLVVSPLAIRHAAEAKQYGFDLLATVVVLHAAAVYVSGSDRRRSLIWLAVAGSATLFISHAVVFVTASAGLALLGRELWMRRAVSRGLLAAGAAVLFTALANYAFVLRPILDTKGHHPYWERFYLPFPPESPEEMQQLATAPLMLFDKALGMSSAGLGAAVLLLGLVGWVIRRQAVWAVVVALPLVLLLVSAMLELYPYYSRFVVFAIPLLALGVAAGLEGFLSARSRKFVWTGALLALLVIGGTGRDAFRDKRFWRPFEYQEIGPLLEYVQSRLQPDDVVLVDGGAWGAYLFHANWDPRLDALRSHPKVVHRDRAFKYSQLDGERRVWIVFTHVPRRGLPQKWSFLEGFDRRGRRIDQRAEDRATAYLYDLTQ